MNVNPKLYLSCVIVFVSDEPPYVNVLALLPVVATPVLVILPSLFAKVINLTFKDVVTAPASTSLVVAVVAMFEVLS